MSCTPTGSPSAVNPAGIPSTGTPAIDHGTTVSIQRW